MVFGVLAVLTFSVVAEAIAADNEPAVLGYGLVGIGWFIALIFSPRWNERTLHRIDAAVRSAQDLLRGESGD